MGFGNVRLVNRNLCGKCVWLEVLELDDQYSNGIGGGIVILR